VTTDRPNWFETRDGMIVCGPCRAILLAEWAPGTGKAGVDAGGHSVVLTISPDEEVRPTDFTNLGRTPWAGNSEPDRYIQCDQCLGQWGPDA
jgi:hypothetical protein